MLQKALKAAGTIAKAAKSKSTPDIIKAGTVTVGLLNKVTKKKKKDQDKRKQRARR